MKLKFKHQDFQPAAVDAVCSLFEGQRRTAAAFDLERGSGQTAMQTEYGVGNALQISAPALLANMRAVQRRNNLPQTDDLSGNQFSIEMETGTGKTYVYTKTIFELHRQYGFTKFIIVVPSIAVREGVYKSLQITREHFAALYENTPCRYFIYQSAKLSDVRQFATSSGIEIMIINIDAFRKAENVINQQQDRLNGAAAIRYIQDTRPVVIIDEPQSVDNTQKARDAVAALNPLCVLRYSATHRKKVNLLYRLTPVDACQMGLVKQICVSSNQVADGFNRPYIRLLSVSREKGFQARVELDIKGKNGRVSRRARNVRQGTDLCRLSGGRELYEGYVLSGIDCTPGMEQIEFANTETLPLGRAIGDVDENLVKRAQIRRTIEAHLDKELRYTEKGIKVLSLFFIDEVKKYRSEDGGKGIYARMFEELYGQLLALPRYAPLRERFPAEAAAVHDGYFSQDRRGNYKNTRGDTRDDSDAYSTIMRDKEWLLSFACPLRFIFSHSALKEGWDNPNVFQVCTLMDQKSILTARQKIGRGLRLCVDQNGERIEDRNINLLHVMANESFAEFAGALQREMEEETGVRFGILQLDLFSGLAYTETETVERPLSEEQARLVLAKAASPQGDNALPRELEAVRERVAAMVREQGEPPAAALAALTYTAEVRQEKSVTYEDARALLAHFERKGYITGSGRITDAMRAALQSGTLALPRALEGARPQLERAIRRADARPPVWDGARDVRVRLKKDALASPVFLALWDRIRQKTVYRVEIDEAALIRRSAQGLARMEPIPKARIVTQTASIHIDSPGVSYTERGIRTMDVEDSGVLLPNALAAIGEQALVKRSTVYEICRRSGRAQDLLNNPQMFIEQAAGVIRQVRQSLAVDGIRYQRLEGEVYQAREVFDAEELTANLDRNAVAVEHSVYDHIICDSAVERRFALALDRDPDVKLFLKLPRSFTVDTPAGCYSPDWAVCVEEEGGEMSYLVIETKGSSDQLELRPREDLKLRCGRMHFQCLGTGVELHGPVADWRAFRSRG